MGIPTDPRDERVTAPAPPPALVIRLAVEARPRLYVDCVNDGERERLVDWLRSSDDLSRLVDDALELSRLEPAA
jgi:hypothetical protein